MQPPRGLTVPSYDAPIATARWAYPSEIAAYAYQPGDIWLGVVPYPDPDDRDAPEEPCAGLEIGVGDDRHMVTIGGTRAGKGTTLIVPNLRRYPGSVICIDPKGENARLTIAHRGGGTADEPGLDQTVCVLDPYNTTGLPDELKAGWNALDLVRLDDRNCVDRAASIADGLVVATNPENAHFDDAARMFIKALILYVALKHEGRPSRNLVTVHELLMRGAPEQLAADRAADPAPDDPDAFTYLLQLMQEVDAFGGVIAGAATMLLGMGDRELGAVLSTARRNLEFIERPAMQDVLRSSSINLDQLKADPAGVTVYLCLPPQRMSDCGRWLRLMIASCLERMYEIDAEPATGYSVLFLLEEFATLRHMEIIEHAAGYAAGFGVKLWVIVQDIAQLKRHYRDGWETFLGNAGAIQAFGNSDISTLDFLSKKLGEVEVSRMVESITNSMSASTNAPAEQHRLQGFLGGRGATGLLAGTLGLMADPDSRGESASSTVALTQQLQRCPLLLPDEIERLFRREAMTELLLIKGQAPMIVERVPYYPVPPAEPPGS